MGLIKVKFIKLDRLISFIDIVATPGFSLWPKSRSHPPKESFGLAKEGIKGRSL
jgi:hypothetical protein